MSNDIVRDVEAAIGIVERNYAGYADKRERFGAAAIAAATAAAREAAAAAGAGSPEDGHRIIDDFLQVFRDGHLQLEVRDSQGRFGNYSWARKTKAASVSAAPRQSDPGARVVSDEVFLLTIPSFDLKRKAPIKELVGRSDAEIRRREHLVIDLRGNGGGADAAYGCLLPYLYTGPVTVVGADVLASRESADAWEAILAQIPEREAGTRAFIRGIVGKMRAAPEGTFIRMVEDETVTRPEVLPRPAQVAILIDGGCGSTTEQFLLAARQSRKVTVFGRNSAGVLDYANVRPFVLPSGGRVLVAATTRSRRLPKEPVDNIGIAPHVRIEDLKAPGAADDRAVDFILRHWGLKPPAGRAET